MAKTKTLFENFIEIMDIAVRLEGGLPLESVAADLGTTRTQVFRMVTRAKDQLNVQIDYIKIGPTVTHIKPETGCGEFLEAMAELCSAVLN